MRRLSLKFAISIGAALIWLALSAQSAAPWLRGAAGTLTGAWAVIAVAGVALLPGYLACGVALSNRLNARRQPEREPYAEPVTVMIYAHNAEGHVYPAMRAAMEQDYSGRIDVLCVDNASTDGTWLEAARAVLSLRRANRRARLMACPGAGRGRALDAGLRAVRTRYLVVMDADAMPDGQAVGRVIRRIARNRAGCALGSVRVGQPRTWVQWMQACDCQTALDAVRRCEGGYGAALAARAAFAAFDAAAVRSVGGWGGRAEGDASVICRLLERGWASLYAPDAVVRVAAPDTLRALCRQRTEWAGILCRSLRDVTPWRQRTFYAGYFEALNLSAALLALAYGLGVLAGLALLAVGPRWFAIWLSLLALPGMLIGAPAALRFWRSAGPAEVWRCLWGGLCHAVCFRSIQAACTLMGYAQARIGRGGGAARKEV